MFVSIVAFGKRDLFTMRKIVQIRKPQTIIGGYDPVI